MDLRKLRRYILMRSLLPLSSIFMSNGKSQISIRILTYHNVGFKRGKLTIEPSQFQDQMQWLSKHDYRVIGLDKLGEWLRGECSLSPKSVIITFDDGFENLYWHAFPVLQRYGWPAIFFLVPSWLGEKQDFLNWGQIREMKRSGMHFGSHTLTHRLLCSISPTILRKEIVLSKEILEQRLGEPVLFFCFPSGYYDQTAIEEVCRAGYKLACSTRPGLNYNYIHPLVLRRTEISVRDTIEDFSGKLTGRFDFLMSIYWFYRRFAQRIGLKN